MRFQHRERRLELSIRDWLKSKPRLEFRRIGDVRPRALPCEFVVLFGRHDDLHVRRDAFLVNAGAGGREITRRRKPKPFPVVQLEYGLDGTLAERTFAHDHGAMRVLQGTGDNFRRAGCAGIDQDNDG